MRYAWDYNEDEPILWWNCFLYYCTLGPGRSVARARAVVEAQQRFAQEVHAATLARALSNGGDPPLHSLSQWQRMARRYRWQARARAWDTWLAQRARTPSDLSLLLEQRRNDIVLRQMLSRAAHIFAAANLETLDMQQARKLLPLAQRMIREFLQAQRELIRLERESGAFADQPRDAGDGPDDGAHAWQGPMLDAVRQLQQLAEAGLMPSGKPGEPTVSALIAALEAAQRAGQSAAPVPAAAPAPAHVPAGESHTPGEVAGKQLLVVTGNNSRLGMDLAMVRGAARETGLNYHHIANATRADLETSLRRARSLGRPITWVHLACHASHAGVLFADGLGDGAWLSSVLMGVEVLLIAGCNGDRVGDWLAVIPYVITLSDAISHDDAATLTRHFWEELARKETPTAALAKAMARCPQVLWESVVAHW